MTYNYTIVIDHKPKIVIPYTNISVRGKLFLVIVALISLIINSPLILVGLFFNISELLMIATSTYIVTIWLLTTASQIKSEESNNYHYVDHLYNFYYKRIGYNKVYLSNGNVKWLIKGRKVRSIDVVDLTNYN